MLIRPNKNGLHNVQNVYMIYAERLLKSNPEYWGRFSNRISNYYIYKKEGNKVIEIISYKRFRTIVNTYFFKAKRHIIEGKALNLGHGVGRIAARTVERNFNNEMVDWGKTMKLRAERNSPGLLVFFTNDTWSRIGWKRNGRLKNESLYRFTPADGNKENKGFKDEFTEALRADPLLETRYEYFPYVLKKQIQ